MAGKVFISCGQRESERGIAERLSTLLSSEFGLTPYLAFKVQSLDDIMTITKQLRSSDYYLFIDFFRQLNDENDLPISLFTHQELALAHHLGFENMIALQQDGAPLQGFMRYILANPEPFTDENDLLGKVRCLVRERRWTPNYSRNLVVSGLQFTDLLTYRDHTGQFIEWVCQVSVHNLRPDAASVGTVCILDRIQRADGTDITTPIDRAYLKWAGQAGYERTILPNDSGVIDLLSIHAKKPGLFLHSLRDTPRAPIVSERGVYKLFFKLFSPGFPLVEFSVRLDMVWTPPEPPQPPSLQTTASLITQ